MKLLKIFSTSFIAIIAVALVGQTSVALATEGLPSSKVIDMQKVAKPTSTTPPIAQIKIENAKIISQVNNIIKVSFDISNKDNAQSGMKYGIKLLKKVDKALVLMDEYVYPNKVNIGANSTIKEEITYQAPDNIKGNFVITISLKNYSGVPMGSQTAGQFTILSAVDNKPEIITETCFTSKDKTVKEKEANQTLSISQSENIYLTCDVINNSKEEIESSPSYQTFYRTIYGDVVDGQGGDKDTILFKSGEKKTVTLMLPKVTIPQVYITKVVLGEGIASSNPVFVSYVLSGSGANIQNITLDKTSYEKGDIAKLSLFWTPLLQNKDDKISTTLNINITNSRQKACIAPINQVLDKAGRIEIPATMLINCNDPQVTALLKDANGNILDQKQLSFKPTDNIETPSMFSRNITIIAIIGIIIVALILVYFIIIKKRKNEKHNETNIHE